MSDPYTYQHDPRISGADFEDDDLDPCPKCGNELSPYDESQDGYWCGVCLEWYAYFSGGLVSFDELDAIRSKE